MLKVLLFKVKMLSKRFLVSVAVRRHAMRSSITCDNIDKTQVQDGQVSGFM